MNTAAPMTDISPALVAEETLHILLCPYASLPPALRDSSSLLRSRQPTTTTNPASTSRTPHQG